MTIIDRMARMLDRARVIVAISLSGDIAVEVAPVMFSRRESRQVITNWSSHQR
jgi:hypothetical protein